MLFLFLYLPINLMQIDAGLGQVVATNTSQIPYYLVGDEWIRLPGSLKHITAGPAGILGVYKADSIYKYVAGNWVQVAGKWRALLNISPEDTCFLAFLLPSGCSPLPWTGMPGSVKYYSCGPFGCWAVNKNDDIYLMSVRSGKECEKWSSVVEDGERQEGLIMQESGSLPNPQQPDFLVFRGNGESL
uniref:Uncharacterized protein n=1 Tax=Hucho hucho TaxID=62062 RepID=A0A4W5PN01_9TELE